MPYIVHVYLHIDSKKQSVKNFSRPPAAFQVFNEWHYSIKAIKIRAEWYDESMVSGRSPFLGENHDSLDHFIQPPA